jgi:hypothetical protein
VGGLRPGLGCAFSFFTVAFFTGVIAPAFADGFLFGCAAAVDLVPFGAAFFFTAAPGVACCEASAFGALFLSAVFPF